MSPSIQDVCIFTATTICILNEFIGSSLPIALIARKFRDVTIKRRVALMNQILIIGLILQVSLFVTLEHKSKSYSKYLLEDSNPCSFTVDQAVKIPYRLSFFIKNSKQQCFGGFNQSLNTDGTGSQYETDGTSSNTREKEKQSKLVSNLSKESEADIDVNTKIDNEIKGYSISANQLSNKFPVSFWRCSEIFYPYLARVAKFLFTVSACSTGSKRVFSIFGVIRGQRRCRLTGLSTKTIIIAVFYLQQTLSL